MECVFCSIIGGRITGSIVYQTDLVTAFRDINPVAPTHVLIVPNKHITSTEDLSPDEPELAAELLLAVKQVAALEQIEQSGYRLIVNTGPDGHQEVPHLHIHVLGGGPMLHGMG